MINHIDYATFGRATSESNSAAGDRFRFTGREWDEELGLYYYRARYYDPTQGRFLSEDSYGFDAGDPNLYRYVVNGPTNASDPSGHVAAIEYATKAVLIAEKLIEPLGCIQDNLAFLKVKKAIFRGATGLRIPKVELGRIPLGEVPLAEGQDVYVTVESCSRFLPAAHFGATMSQLAIVLDLYTRSKPHTTVTSSFEASSPDDISQFSLKVFGSLSRDGAIAGGGGANAGGADGPSIGGPPPASGGGPGGAADPPGPLGSSASEAVGFLCRIFDEYYVVDELLFTYAPCDNYASIDRLRALGIATELVDQIDPDDLLNRRVPRRCFAADVWSADSRCMQICSVSRMSLWRAGVWAGSSDHTLGPLESIW